MHSVREVCASRKCAVPLVTEFQPLIDALGKAPRAPFNGWRSKMANSMAAIGFGAPATAAGGVRVPASHRYIPDTDHHDLLAVKEKQQLVKIAADALVVDEVLLADAVGQRDAARRLYKREIAA